MQASENLIECSLLPDKGWAGLFKERKLRMDGNILITGAGSGIGRDTAFELARRGHRVIASTRNNERALQLKRAVEAAGLEITVQKLDILQPEDRDAALEWDIDVLVNNAGVGQSGPLAEIPLERVRDNFETNVFATLALTQAVVKQMLRKGCGRIIIVGSLAGRVYVPYIGAYCMTKFALEAEARALRYELKRHNIKVSIIEPGPYGTGFNEQVAQTKYEWFDDNSLLACDVEIIKEQERKLFAGQRSNESIVKQIVNSVESVHPKFRYVAPLKYKILVQLGVLFGR